MNRKEAAALLGHCSAFDNRQPSTAAATAWASALHDVPFDDDATAAVAVYYTTPPQNPNERLWILPHHVRTLRAKIRSQRLENYQYEPVHGETTAEYLVRLRGQVKAIASGGAPAPTGRPVLEGGPSKAFTAELEAHGWSIGRQVPDSDDASLTDEVRRAGPIGVVCPTCSAAIGRPCKTPGSSAKAPLGKPRRKPHSARLRAAKGEAELTPEQQAAAEERVREAARRATTRMDTEDDIPDAEIVDDEVAS